MSWKVNSGIRVHYVSVAVVFAKKYVLATFLPSPSAKLGM